MAGWLNTPVLILDGSRSYKEPQSFVHPISYFSWNRSRAIKLENERYVGGDKQAADAKADELASNAAYSDVSVAPAGGGQYHVIATKKTEGVWSAWVQGPPPAET